MRQTLGLVHYDGRRYKEAADASRRALELAPQLGLARVTLVKSLYQQGAYAEAAKVGEAGPPPWSADLRAMIGLSHLRAGDAGRADEMLQTLRAQAPLPAMSLALWYAALGDRDQAMAMLTRGTRPGVAPSSVGADPLFDSLRTDERFSSLLSRNLL